MRKAKPRFDLPKIVARKVTPVQPGRRARIGLDSSTPRKEFDTTGIVERHSESRAPRTYEPGFSEIRRFTTTPMAKTTRQFRLWSKYEI